MLITSICFQGITSYLVYINFSLCMVIPQSFHFVGQIVNLYVLSKMGSKWPPRACRHTCKRRLKLSMTWTHSSRGIAPILAVIVVLKSLSVGCFHTLGPLHNPKGKNLGGLNRVSVTPTQCHTSYWWVDRFSNHRLSHKRVLLEVWGVAPSCWNHCSSLASAACCPKLPKHHCCVTENFTHRLPHSEHRFPAPSSKLCQI